MAFVVPRAGGALTPEGLIGWARGRLANYKVPRYVEFCDGLPANAVGKVAKDELRERGRVHVAILTAADTARRSEEDRGGGRGPAGEPGDTAASSQERGVS